jgi:hypothetical protein
MPQMACLQLNRKGLLQFNKMGLLQFNKKGLLIKLSFVCNFFKM